MNKNSISNLHSIFNVLFFGICKLFLFTFIVSILLLIQPIYMLQIYDRVLSSFSYETLLFISLFAGGALVLLGIADSLRSMIASRLAAKLEVGVGSNALIASMNAPQAVIGDVQPLRDLHLVRDFVSGRAVLAFLDLPFSPIFIGVLYLIHPNLFWLTAGGVLVLVAIAFANQLASARWSDVSTKHHMQAIFCAQAFVRNSESIRAMGMRPQVVSSWGREEALSLSGRDRLNRINGIFSGFSRMFRLGLQIAILGYGGFLVLRGDMTAGMIFASSLLAGRGLQPIDQVIAGWKSFVEAQKALKRLSLSLNSVEVSKVHTKLPRPKGAIDFENVVVYPQSPQKGLMPQPVLKGINASIAAGECLAIIGPSGAGKSTLLRALVGAVEVQTGVIRIDGADIGNWNSDQLGHHIGYLAQDVELLPGTIAQNIARFDDDVASEEVLLAAKKAHAHDLIQQMTGGYDTVVGPNGIQLSGGQRQRIGLARAFFRTPALLVLDEPNASLDSDGDVALDRAIAGAQGDGVSVVIVTQRQTIVQRANKIMLLKDGSVSDFGPKSEVLERYYSGGRRRSSEETSRKASVVQGRFSSGLTAKVASSELS